MRVATVIGPERPPRSRGTRSQTGSEAGSPRNRSGTLPRHCRPRGCPRPSAPWPRAPRRAPPAIAALKFGAFQFFLNHVFLVPTTLLPRGGGRILNSQPPCSSWHCWWALWRACRPSSLRCRRLAVGLLFACLARLSRRGPPPQNARHSHRRTSSETCLVAIATRSAVRDTAVSPVIDPIAMCLRGAADPLCRTNTLCFAWSGSYAAKGRPRSLHMQWSWRH